MEKEDAQKLFDTFNDNCPYTITEEQSQKGIDWLSRSLFKRNGGLRNSKSRPFTDTECTRIKLIIEKFGHWRFTGLHDIGTGGYSSFVPTYKIISKNNKLSFEYFTSQNGAESTNNYFRLVK
jgi:hypothetical protein